LLAFELVPVEGAMGRVISALVFLSCRKQQNSMHLGCNLRQSVNTLKSPQIYQIFFSCLIYFKSRCILSLGPFILTTCVIANEILLVFISPTQQYIFQSRLHSIDK
jgi:hypothetical protein